MITLFMLLKGFLERTERAVDEIKPSQRVYSHREHRTECSNTKKKKGATFFLNEVFVFLLQWNNLLN